MKAKINRLLCTALSLALVLGLMPWVSLTARAENSNEGWKDIEVPKGEYILVCSAYAPKVLTINGYWDFQFNTYNGGGNQKWQFLGDYPSYVMVCGGSFLDVQNGGPDLEYGSRLNWDYYSDQGEYSEYDTNVFRISQRKGGPEGSEVAIRSFFEGEDYDGNVHNMYDCVITGNANAGYKADRLTTGQYSDNNKSQYWTLYTVKDYEAKFVHDFTYEAKGATISANCSKDGCALHDKKAVLTIEAYNTGARITGDTSVFESLPEINYYHANEDGTKGAALDPITTAPASGGKYWAEFTLGTEENSATAHVVYDIVPVASIGESKYLTLKDALDNVNDGQTIKLLSDIHETVTFDKSDATVTLDLNGNTIDGDQAGTVVTVENGTLILDDGSEAGSGIITDGYTDGNGGGVSVTDGTFTLKNGSIEGNFAANGGGVSVTGGNFNMLGGAIQFNEGGSSAGGVYSASIDGSFTMSGGAIRYNVGKVCGGILVDYAQPKFSGTAVVEGNICKDQTNDMIIKDESGYVLAEGGTPCDVRCAESNGLKLSIAGELTEGASIGISNNGQTDAFTDGFHEYNPDSNASAFFFSNDPGKRVSKDDNGEVIFVKAYTVDEVIAMINELPAAGSVKTADKDKIAAARDAYDSLAADKQSEITADVLKKLTDDEAAIQTALTVDMINALPAAADIKLSHKEAIEKARAAYDALSDAQKANVDQDVLKKLTDSEAALAEAIKKDAADKEAADKVSLSINALPAAADIKISHKEAVEKARAAYDALTQDQKAKVSSDTLKKLTDAEDKLVIIQVMSEVSVKSEKELTYTGKPIQLINPPTTALPAGFTMVYAVTTEDKAPAASAYTASVPSKTEAKTFYVWYMVKGDENHFDSEPEKLTATIINALVLDTELEGVIDEDGNNIHLTVTEPEDSIFYNGKKHVVAGTALKDSQKKTMSADIETEVAGLTPMYKVSYVYKDHKTASTEKPYFYIKLAVDKKSAQFKTLDKKQKSAVSKAVSKANKLLKEADSRIRFKIQKRDLSSFSYEKTEEAGKKGKAVIFSDGDGNLLTVNLSFTTKKGKTTAKIKNVKLTYTDGTAAAPGKPVTEGAKQIERSIVNNDDGSFTINLKGNENGKTPNYTGKLTYEGNSGK